jgi:hypothetical protein
MPQMVFDKYYVDLATQYYATHSKIDLWGETWPQLLQVVSQYVEEIEKREGHFVEAITFARTTEDGYPPSGGPIDATIWVDNPNRD